MGTQLPRQTRVVYAGKEGPGRAELGGRYQEGTEVPRGLSAGTWLSLEDRVNVGPRESWVLPRCIVSAVISCKRRSN